ncbi:MAG: sulfotransferase [Gracilimonas sp.]|uniref:sulfotransferase family protein n=1 Tax=Gracilimonas sp. TaxID=1974203 RepID=UPI00199F2677|nr:sulfotransferase [Gracilimonas sp.]MBD3616866.1 sulfotransferase [Gracilimonas sp.]
MKSSQTHTKLCFIGGSGRSGTTILRTVLSSHPDAAGMHEFRITTDPDGLIDFYTSLANNWNPYLFDIKLKRLEHLLKSASLTFLPEKAYRFLLKKTGFQKLPFKLERKNAGVSITEFCPDYDVLVNALIDDLREFSYKGFSMGNEFGSGKIHFASFPDKNIWRDTFGKFYREMTASVVHEQQASAFVDDNTWNILHFDTLMEWLPEAKLIHIYRHPLDVISSFTKQAWAPKNPIQAAHFYVSLLERWFKIRETLPGKSYREISLENLCSNPEDVLKEVADFYELEWNSALLSVDLSKSNTGRWKTDLPNNLLPEIKKIVQPILHEYGYSTND